VIIRWKRLRLTYIRSATALLSGLCRATQEHLTSQRFSLEGPSRSQTQRRTEPNVCSCSQPRLERAGPIHHFATVPVRHER
jgi:hypothetical protein